MTDLIHPSEDAQRGHDDLARFEASREALLAANEGYDITKQHDACGVGLVCAIDGKPRREVVELAIVPQDFFAEQVRRTGHTLTLFRKLDTGAWVLSRDANLMPPPARAA